MEVEPSKTGLSEGNPTAWTDLFVPPRKSAPVVEVENRLAARAWPQKISLCGQTFHYQPASLPPVDLTDFVRLTFRINGDPSMMLLTRSLFQWVIGAIDPATDTDALDGKVTAMLLESSLSAQIEMMEKLFDWKVVFEEISPADNQPVAPFWLKISPGVAGGNDDWVGLTLSANWTERWLAILPEKSHGAHRNITADIPVTLPIRAGSTTIGTKVLMNLVPKDVILLEHTLLAADRVGVVIGGTWVFDATIDSDRVILSSAHRKMNSRDRDLWQMHDDLTSDDQQLNPDTAETVEADDRGSDPHAAFSACEDLPVKLVFEIGQLEVSIADLERLGAGHVFDLNHNLRQCVDIYAAGRRLGQGDIVEINGRIGVRLARLFGHG